MGPLLAIFLVVALNQAPAGVETLTVSSYVVEGVGIYPDATDFRVARLADGGWQLHDAFDEPWFVVDVRGPMLTLVSAEGARDEVDMGAAFGLPDEPWWAGAEIAPPGNSPLLLEHVSGGITVTIEGMRAAEIRW